MAVHAHVEAVRGRRGREVLQLVLGSHDGLDGDGGTHVLDVHEVVVGHVGGQVWNLVGDVADGAEHDRGLLAEVELSLAQLGQRVLHPDHLDGLVLLDFAVGLRVGIVLLTLGFGNFVGGILNFFGSGVVLLGDLFVLFSQLGLFGLGSLDICLGRVNVTLSF